MTATDTTRPVLLPVWSGRSSLLHSGMSVARFYGLHWFAAIFPAGAGLALFGWRALAAILAILAGATIGAWAWRRIGWRGHQLRLDHTLWLALLLAMMLPAHLATGTPSEIGGEPLWLILPTAGLVLAMFNWLLGGVGAGRVHPVLLTFLLLWVCFPRDLVPHQVLQRSTLVTGDLADVTPPPGGRVAVQSREPWLDLKPIERDAIWREPASQRLIFYTTGLDKEAGWQSIEGLIRDRMPPLEDLIIGGQPAPIGSGSALAVIIGGLFLLYRGLIDWRIPLLMIAAAYVLMLIAPVPVVITDLGPTRRWLYATELGVGWATALTFVHYQILAGPMLLTAFFIATAPAIRPTTRRGCILFGLAAGALAAVCQLFASVSFGAPLAVLLVSMITPALDRWIRPRPLV